MNTIKYYFIFTIYTICAIISEPAMAVLPTNNISANEFKELLNIDSNNTRHLISNFKINDFIFPEQTITNIYFKNTIWNNIDAKNRVFTNIAFEDCTLSDINFRNMEFENIEFKNCTLTNVVMNQSKIDKITFDNCNIASTDTNIENNYRELNAESIIFKNSQLKGINFYESKANFIFQSSKLNDVSGYGLQSGSSIIIKDSDIFDFNFSDSSLSILEIYNSNIKESKVNDSTIGNVILENNEFYSFPIASSKKYGTITVKNTSEITVHGTGPVKDVSITECKKYKDIYISEMIFDNALVENCRVPRITAFEIKGKKLTISNVDTHTLDLEEAEIDHLILNNVNIEGEIYASDAKIKKYEAHNVTVQEGVIIKDKGANFKIETTK